MSNIKVGSYYHYKDNIGKVINDNTSWGHILIEFDTYTENSSPITGVKFREYISQEERYVLNDDKFYRTISESELTLAYRAVKDTKLARKMYPKPFKIEKGYLYVKF